MKHHKTITALIIVAAIMTLTMGFASMALAIQAPSTCTTELAKAYLVDQQTAESISQDAVITEKGQASVPYINVATMVKLFSGKTINTAVLADQMVAKAVISNYRETKPAESKHPITLFVTAETVPKYIGTNIDSTMPGLSGMDGMVIYMNAGGMGGIPIAWQNGGGPATGVLPIMGSEMAVTKIDKKISGTVIIV